MPPIQRRAGDKPEPLQIDLSKTKEVKHKIVFGAPSTAIESVYIDRQSIAPFGDRIRITIEAI